MKPHALALFLMAGFAFMAQTVQAADPQEGAFGQAFDACKGTLTVAADAAWGTPPITVECRVKLLGKDQYNILVANEMKASATHWEIFTTPGDGVLHAYVPGRAPDHVHTSTQRCPSWTGSGTASPSSWNRSATGCSWTGRRRRRWR